MTYSKYACDTCDATAEPGPENRRGPPAGWEHFRMETRGNISIAMSEHDICPTCIRRPLVELLAALREKRSKERTA